MEEYKSSGNWDAYLSMDKWQQSLNDYTSMPVYFDRSIMGQNTMERNGVKGSCSFATVKTAEEIQKEIDDRVKAAEKNGSTLREALANAFPNAVNTLFSFVGFSVVMTFDEYVKAQEIIVKPDDSRVLVMMMSVGGMETTMSLEISKPTKAPNENLGQDTDNNMPIAENDMVSDEMLNISNKA